MHVSQQFDILTVLKSYVTLVTHVSKQFDMFFHVYKQSDTSILSLLYMNVSIHTIRVFTICNYNEPYTNEVDQSFTD